MINHKMFTCDSVEWETPQELFDELNREFGFTLDPCASHNNAKCITFFTKEQDGLLIPWATNVVFMNPPYGREIKAWMRKAFVASLNGATVVCLVPARTDTTWWHCYAMQGEIRFLKGRIKFKRHTISGHLDQGPAPFPSAIVIFRP